MAGTLVREVPSEGSSERSSGGTKPVSAMPTLGTMHSITEKPRTSCGRRSCANPHSGPIADIIHRLVANRISPGVITSRGSTVCDSRAAISVPRSCPPPVTNTVSPMSRLE